jgi:hypothetical protein
MYEGHLYLLYLVPENKHANGQIKPLFHALQANNVQKSLKWIFQDINLLHSMKFYLTKTEWWHTGSMCICSKELSAVFREWFTTIFTSSIYLNLCISEHDHCSSFWDTSSEKYCYKNLILEQKWPNYTDRLMNYKWGLICQHFTAYTLSQHCYPQILITNLAHVWDP